MDDMNKFEHENDSKKDNNSEKKAYSDSSVGCETPKCEPNMKTMKSEPVEHSDDYYDFYEPMGDDNPDAIVSVRKNVEIIPVVCGLTHKGEFGAIERPAITDKIYDPDTISQIFEKFDAFDKVYGVFVTVIDHYDNDIEIFRGNEYIKITQNLNEDEVGFVYDNF